MIGQEFLRLFSRWGLLAVATLIVPILIVIAFVPSVVNPIPQNTNRAEASRRLYDLRNMIDGLSQSYDASIRENLVDAWVAFGGRTDDEQGDITGAYHAFFRAEMTHPDHFTDAINYFRSARTFFNVFYDIFYRYVYDMPTPKVFITQSNLNALVDGTKQLFQLFQTEPTDIHALRNRRDQMNNVRRSVDFRQILSETRNMFLTPQQATILHARFNLLDHRRDQVWAIGYAEYVDFCNMIYSYITIRMNRFIQSNANFSTSNFMGFTTFERQEQSRELYRLEYLFETQGFDMNYSRPPGGLVVFGTFTIMHAGSGTTIIDFMFHGAWVAFIALVVFAIIVTAFVIFVDIKNKTVIGTIATTQSRHRIIWTKIGVSMLCITTLLLIFYGLFALIGASIIGGTSLPPTVLAVFMGNVISMSPIVFLILQCLYILAKLFLLVLLTAFLSVIFNNQYILAALCTLAVAAVVLLPVFLTPFNLFIVIFLPCIILLGGIFLVGTTWIFKKKEF